MKNRLLLLLMALSGCVNTLPDSSSLDIGDQESALDEPEPVDPADAPAVCSKANMSWVPGDEQRCSANWEYSRRGLCWSVSTAAATAHDTSACTEWNQCDTTWCNGDVSSGWVSVGSSNAYPIPAKHCEVDCQPLPHGGQTCSKPHCSNPEAEAQSACTNTYVKQKIDAKTAELPDEGLRAKVHGRGDAVALGNNNWRCDMELNYPVRATAVGKLCGCKTTTRYTPVPCDTRPVSSTRVFSSGGLTSAQLLAEDSHAYMGGGPLGGAVPSCSSCEQMPIDTAAQVRAKFACLCSSWNKLPGVPACSLNPPAASATATALAASESSVNASKAGTNLLTSGTVIIGPIFNFDPYPNCSNNPPTIAYPQDTSIVEYRGAGAGSLDAGQIPAFVKHFRLLMELGGDRLPAHVRTFITGLYGSYPSYEHTCSAAHPGGSSLGRSASVEIPASCPAATATDLDAKLARCEHFAQPHVPSNVALIEQGQCLALLDGLNQLNSSDEAACVGPALRTAARAAATTMLVKSFKLLESSPNTTYGALPRQLNALSLWWDAFSRSHAHDVDLEPEPEVPADPVATLSGVLGRFWKHATEGRAVLTGLRTTLQTDPTTAELQTALGSSNQNAETLDRLVLTAALTNVGSLPAIVDGSYTVLPAITVNAAPLRGFPLLLVTGDALSRLSGHLDALTPSHDFACRFTDCRAPTFTSSTVRLTALFAALETKTRLTAELDAIPVAVTLDGWRAVFDAFKSSYDTFRAALDQVALTNLSGSAPAFAHPSATLLITAVQRQNDRIASFRSRGLFDATNRRALFAGVDDLVRSNVLQRMNSRIQAISSEQGRLEQDLESLATGLVEIAGTQHASDDIQTQRDLLGLQLDQLQAEVTGLEGSGDAEALRLGDITAQLANIGRAVDQGQLLQVSDTLSARPTGANAKHVPFKLTETLADLSVLSVTKEQLGNARMLAVESRGVWSPTCALRNVKALLPDPAHPDKLLPQRLSFAGALIGPEGYVITQSQGQATVDSVGSSHEAGWTHSTGNRFELCAEAGFNLGKAVGIGENSPLTLSVSAKDCGVREDMYNQSDRDTSSHNNNTDVSSNASYAVGLRLPTTPVPEAPAGSLLAVVAPHGATTLGPNYPVYIVRSPFTTMLVPADSDVHFIVNDTVCPDGETPDTFNPLDITVRPLATIGALAGSVVTEMAKTIKDVSAREPDLLAQGTVLPNQLSQIRSAAIVSLEVRTQLAFSALPSPLQNLFNSYLDLALLDLERRVEIQARLRLMHQLYLQTVGLDTDQADAERVGRLALLVPLWHLHALPEQHLRAALSDLYADTDRYLLPIMELWYPRESDTAPSAAFNVAIQNLINATPSTRFSDLVANVVTVVQDALSRFQDAEAWNRPYNTHSHAALSWDLPVPAAAPPAPGVSKSPFRRAAAVSGGPASLGVDPVAAVRELKTGVFHVTPEDLYSPSGGVGGVIWCQEAVPVISRMALFVARTVSTGTTNAQLNGQRRWVSGRVSGVRFQTESMSIPYDVDVKSWQEFKIPVIFGTPGSAIETFDELIGRPESVYAMGPAGMSPFADFAVDFDGLGEARLNPNDTDGFTIADPTSPNGRKFSSSEIILVMKLDSRSAAAPLANVQRCVPPNAQVPTTPPVSPPSPPRQAPPIPF
jgi:hypothetical protein